MNVTSGLAFIPFSKVPVYSRTKAFMRSFTLPLRHQMKVKNIDVVEIIPPALIEIWEERGAWGTT